MNKITLSSIVDMGHIEKIRLNSVYVCVVSYDFLFIIE